MQQLAESTKHPMTFQGLPSSAMPSHSQVGDLVLHQGDSLYYGADIAQESLRKSGSAGYLSDESQKPYNCIIIQEMVPRLSFHLLFAEAIASGCNAAI